jgi:hypothetical protein
VSSRRGRYYEAAAGSSAFLQGARERGLGNAKGLTDRGDVGLSAGIEGPRQLQLLAVGEFLRATAQSASCPCRRQSGIGALADQVAPSRDWYSSANQLVVKQYATGAAKRGADSLGCWPLSGISIRRCQAGNGAGWFRQGLSLLKKGEGGERIRLPGCTGDVSGAVGDDGTAGPILCGAATGVPGCAGSRRPQIRCKP